jgi:hypothetical protein
VVTHVRAGSFVAQGRARLAFKRVFRLPRACQRRALHHLLKRLFAIVIWIVLALVESKDLVDRWLKERFLDALISASFRGVTGHFLLDGARGNAGAGALVPASGGQ